MYRTLSTGIVAIVLLSARAAHADARACDTAHDDVKALRGQLKSIEALKETAACLRDECDESVRNHCRTWKAEIENEIPIVSFAAADDAGKAASVDGVTVDGEPVADPKKPLRLDPGYHVFTFTRGAAHVTVADVIPSKSSTTIRGVFASKQASTVSREALFVDARRLFEQACGVAPGKGACTTTARDPSRKKAYLEAATAYENAFDRDPRAEETPEAAMNAAYSFKQAGKWTRATTIYLRFVAEYGAPDMLRSTSRLAERLRYLNEAYAALGEHYFASFDYARAALVFMRQASEKAFEAPRRKDAAKNALQLFIKTERQEELLTAHDLYATLTTTPDELVEADYWAAQYLADQKPAAGAAARAAERALVSFYNAHRKKSWGSPHLIAAAYQIARLERLDGEPTARKWFQETVDAWEAYRAKAPLVDGKSPARLPPYVDWAAESELTLIEGNISESYDNAERHEYEPYVTEIFGEVLKDPKTQKPSYDAAGKLRMKIVGRYQNNANEAMKWDEALEKVGKKYESLEWVPAAFARRGALFDRLRTGLYNVRKLELFTPVQARLLKQLQESGRDELADKADQIGDAALDFWRERKKKELDAADELMVRHYATAIAYGRRYGLKNEYVDYASKRLAYFSEILGDARMRELVITTNDPTNRGAKLTYMPRQYLLARAGLIAVPASDHASSPPLPIP